MGEKRLVNSKYKQLIPSAVITFVIGLFAYGYAFTNFTPAHDGMMTVTHDQAWQTAIGRGLMQVYVKFRGQMDAPWLIGILTLIYTSISVYMTVKAFEIEELWKLFLVASVFALNIAYICSATVYIYLNESGRKFGFYVMNDRIKSKALHQPFELLHQLYNLCNTVPKFEKRWG